MSSVLQTAAAFTGRIQSPILEVIVGSTLHGTSVKDGLEDLDIMSIVVEEPVNMFGFAPVDTWVHRTQPDGERSRAGDVDMTVYGLRKYLRLVLSGNPTLLLALFAPAPFVWRRDERGEELQALAPSIVSKQVHAPFKGYMKKQTERLLGLRGQKNVTRPELVEKYGYDTKYAAHIVRLGLQGEELLHTGRITLPMPEVQRELVRDIRTGHYSLDFVIKMIGESERRIDWAYERSRLPDEPDRAKVQEWMVDVYLSKLAGKELTP